MRWCSASGLLGETLCRPGLGLPGLVIRGAGGGSLSTHVPVRVDPCPPTSRMAPEAVQRVRGSPTNPVRSPFLSSVAATSVPSQSRRCSPQTHEDIAAWKLSNDGAARLPLPPTPLSTFYPHQSVLQSALSGGRRASLPLAGAPYLFARLGRALSRLHPRRFHRARGERRTCRCGHHRGVTPTLCGRVARPVPRPSSSSFPPASVLLERERPRSRRRWRGGRADSATATAPARWTRGDSPEARPTDAPSSGASAVLECLKKRIEHSPQRGVGGGEAGARWQRQVAEPAGSRPEASQLLHGGSPRGRPPTAAEASRCVLAT